MLIFNNRITMSIKINIDNLDLDTRQKLNKELHFKGNSIFKYIFAYNVVNDDIYIPFAYAICELSLKRPIRKQFPEMNVKFVGILREEQIIVKKEALDLLSRTGSVIISMYTGGGKTATSINLACGIKLKTLVIVNKIVLIKQWEDSISQFCPSAKVQKLTTKSKFDDDCDFYIMNAINIPKMGVKFFEKIGLVIGDEIHLLVAETLSKAFLSLNPRYVIALSATAYRNDELDRLIPFFFGKGKINRNLYRNHLVYKINTGIEIKMETSKDTGKVNWGAILKKQSDNEERNELIIKIVRYFKDRNFLVICKRVEQANFLYKNLKDVGEYVDNLVGSKQEFDRDSRILIGILSKVGTGFDWPKLDALMLATDTDNFFIQILGRIFRKKDTLPIVFDIVDNNSILNKHYENRLEVYKKCGGKVYDFKKAFSDF